jgi:hypothetical protein
VSYPRRNAGLRGLLQPASVDLPFLHEMATGAPEVPESFDTSHGWATWMSLGNAPATDLPGDQLTINGGNEVGDCFFAAVYHGLINKALVQAPGGTWSLKTEVFTMPTANGVVGLYLGYQNGLAPGKTADSGPDNGTEPVAGFQWFQKAGIIKRWWPVAVAELDQGTYDSKGVLTAWALDADAEEEFANHQPWLNLPESVDPIEGGHATYRVGKTPRYGTEITWAADQQATHPWEKAHLQAAYGFQAPWEPDPVGYDLRPLDVALAKL